MEPITLHTVNKYWKQASDQAVSFLQYRELLPRRETTFQHLLDKYQMVFSLQASWKLSLVLMVVAHMSVGIIEGVMVKQLFQELIRGVAPDGWPLTLASLLIITVFWGWSLGIGHSFHKAQIRKHEVEPRISYNFMSLVTGIFLALAYMFFLYQLIDTGNKMFPGQEKNLTLLFTFGLAEVFLSYFAVLGWEILYVHFNKWRMERRIRRCKWSIHFHAKNCERHYRYYLQVLHYYNQQKEEPLIERISPQIREAIQYYDYEVAAES